ncbi:unnamed protein product, partial [Rotaria sordida]
IMILQVYLAYLQDLILAEQDPVRRNSIQQQYDLFVTLLKLSLKQHSKQNLSS